MTIVLTLTRDEGIAERNALVKALMTTFETDDRDELRAMSLRGDLAPEDTARVERLRELDFLLDGE
jgi:hypothetical protein